MVNVLITGELSGEVTDDSSLIATGTVFSFDDDTLDPIATNWTINAQPSYGTATIVGSGDSAQWTYVLDANDPVVDALAFGEELTDTFVIQAALNFIEFDRETVSITIFGVCFAQGTLIETADGPMRVENLVTGSKVLTKDGGAQQVIWTGGHWYTPDDCAQDPSLQPVRISAGALGKGVPERDLVVSQQHRILISGPTIELHFDVPDVFVAAKHLCHLPGVEVFMPTEAFGYFHVLCAEHHVLIADGAEAESMFLGDEALHALSSRDLAELISQMSVASDQALTAALVKPTCRRVLKEHEALVIAGNLSPERKQTQTPLLRSRPFLCVSNETTRPSGKALDFAIVSNTQDITKKRRAANM